MTLTGAEILLALVTAERLAELWLARRNTAALIAAGAHEAAPEHYPLIDPAPLTPPGSPGCGGWPGTTLQYAWLGLFLALQGLRVWTLATLGRRWTTPHHRRSRRAACGQGTLPLHSPPELPGGRGRDRLPASGAAKQSLFALVFSLANAALLWIRIRAENAALAEGRP